MYCPQCGTEPASDQRYCRACGANLKVIAKAVSLSDAISRSDGVPAKIKEIVSNIKIAHITDDVSHALEKMNKEIVRSSREPKKDHPWWLAASRRTPEQRRERQITKGTVSLFSGAGLTIFLYFLAQVLVLKLPANVLAHIPFEVDPVIHVIWLIGLIPILSGVGHIIAGLAIRPVPSKQIGFPEQSPLINDRDAVNMKRAPADVDLTPRIEAPASITERTTNILRQ